LEANPGWLETASEIQLRPDGDSELPGDLVAAFSVVGCRVCGGELKPDVVFFGGTVAERTLTAAWALFEQAEVLLVVGSSLTVYSGFRFVRRARELDLPVALINQGPTRADDLAHIKVAAAASEILAALERHLIPAWPGALPQH